MGYKDPAKKKEYKKEYYEKNKEKFKEIFKEYRVKNKEKIKEDKDEYCKKQKQNAYDSITSGEIIDRHKWDIWCHDIKKSAKINKQSYSDDFTNDIMFKMMIQGCFYCGDIATTIDRVDSTLVHTLDNCIGCCRGCNMSKGTADPSTFIRKACYRVCEKYYDDDVDIWYVNKTKPRMHIYKSHAKKKGVSFDLTKEDWDKLVKGTCAYCKRRPTTWFGVDRVVPSQGYILDNVVSCCFDCNLDKLEDDVESMMARNERIINRVISGELVIPRCEKVILHRNHKNKVELV